MKKRLLKRAYERVGIIPGNDFCVPFVSELNEKLGFKTNAREASIGARNKIEMRRLLVEGKVNCPKSQVFYSVEDIEKNKDNFAYPLVIKPPDMSSSLFVELIKNYDELISVARKIFDVKENILDYPIIKAVLIEEYAQGPEFSVELFLEEGAILFSSITEKHKGTLPFFVEIGHVVPSSVTTEEQNAQLIECGLKAAHAIGLKYGPVHVEMVLTDKGPSIIELAARIGGDNIMHLVKYATGVYMPELLVDQVLGHEIDAENKENKGAAIKFLTPQPGKVISIKGLEEVLKSENVVEAEVEVLVGDVINPLSSSEDRAGFVIAIGSTGAEANENAIEMANNIVIVTE